MELPITAALNGISGIVEVTASDYLGSTYSAFLPGTGGDLKSTNAAAAMLEISQRVSAAEKTVTPLENQPNNVQVEISLENNTATISASLPISTATEADGDIVIQAVDYL